MSCPGAVSQYRIAHYPTTQNSSRTLCANWFCRLSLQRVNFPLKCNRNRIQSSQLDAMWCGWPQCPLSAVCLSIVQCTVDGNRLMTAWLLWFLRPRVSPFSAGLLVLFSSPASFVFVNDMRAKVTALMGSKGCPTVGIHLKMHWAKKKNRWLHLRSGSKDGL